jgi:FkbM family methyltransferase
LEVLRHLPSHQSAQLLQWITHSNSQLRQDLFVMSELNFQQGGFFVEFGATDGVTLSNTHLLEKFFGWRGILAEPARCWHSKLAKNRQARVDHRCVWTDSKSTLVFNEVSVPELSTIESFSHLDNHVQTRQTGQRYGVQTVSLNDLLAEHGAPELIEYLSIDTEGSEYEILSRLDFERYRFKIITCEHNFTSNREKIHGLLTQYGYMRKYENLSLFDDWYVSLSCL